MKKSSLCLLVSLLTMSFSAFVNAKAPPINRLAEQLSLTDSQRASMKAMRPHKPKIGEAPGADIRKIRQEIQQLVHRDQFDAAVVRQKYELLFQKKMERAMNRAEFENALWQILTPEQREKWKGLIAERHRKKH